MLIKFSREVVVEDAVWQECEVTCNEKLENEDDIMHWLEYNHWSADVLNEEGIDRRDSRLLYMELDDE
jgi:hypothetical protein